MKFLNKTQQFVQFVSSDKFNSMLVTVFILSQVFFIGKAFAQGTEGPCIDTNQGYSVTREVQSTDTKSETTNNNLLTGVQGVSLANLALVSADVNILCSAEEIKNNPDIPDYAKVGIVGLIDNNMAQLMYNPPSTDVAGHLAKDWVPGYEDSNTSVYAQDGFTYLQNSGVDVLWERSRTFAYILFVIVLIVAGFMIMFRNKIGGQVAITVFNTLPNVIWGLIMVTFSFAIIGLMINVGVVLVNVIAVFFGNTISLENPLSLIGVFFRGTDLTTAGSSSQIAVGIVPAILGGVVGAIGATGGAALPAIIGATVGVALIGLAILGLVGFAALRIYLTLLKAYLGILIDTILAPVLLAMGAIPGQNNISNDWFKRVARNVLTFPGVFLVVNFGLYIFNSDVAIAIPGGLVGAGSNAATIGSMIDGFLKAALLLGSMFMAAEVPKVLEDFIQTAGGKGLANASQSAQKSIQKVPIVGDFF